MAFEEFPIIYSTEKFSGITSNDMLDNHNGQLWKITGFKKAVINDTDNNGIIEDADADDGSAATETWTIDGVQKNLHEVAQYDNSSLYLKDGSTISVDVTVLLFDDGTFAISASKLDNSASGEISDIDVRTVDYTKGITLGTQILLPDGAEYSGLRSFQSFRDFFICFTSGTLITTRNGDVPVEELSIGDEVLTLDHGYQTISWMGSRSVKSSALLCNQKLKPVRIRAGALGNSLPARDLVVSRQHRILARSKLAERTLGTTEVLIPAIKLTEIDGIDVVDNCKEVTYWHLLFDRHEIIFSEGYPTESLFTGPEALKALSPDALEEIQTLFPEVSQPDYEPDHVRPVPVKGKDIKKFVKCVKKNKKALLEPIDV